MVELQLKVYEPDVPGAARSVDASLDASHWPAGITLGAGEAAGREGEGEPTGEGAGAGGAAVFLSMLWMPTVQLIVT